MNTNDVPGVPIISLFPDNVAKAVRGEIQVPPIVTVSLPSLNSGFFSAAPFWILIDLPISEATVDNGIYNYLFDNTNKGI